MQFQTEGWWEKTPLAEMNTPEWEELCWAVTRQDIVPPPLYELQECRKMYDADVWMALYPKVPPIDDPTYWSGVHDSSRGAANHGSHAIHPAFMTWKDLELVESFMSLRPAYVYWTVWRMVQMIKQLPRNANAGLWKDYCLGAGIKCPKSYTAKRQAAYKAKRLKPGTVIDTVANGVSSGVASLSVSEVVALTGLSETAIVNAWASIYMYAIPGCSAESLVARVRMANATRNLRMAAWLVRECGSVDEAASAVEAVRKVL